MKFRATVCVCLAAATMSFACATDPQIAKRKYYESGNQYFLNKKYAEATVQYNNALRQDPKFGEARLKLAEAYKALGNIRLAFPEYVRAADLLPDNDEAQLKAGNLLIQGGFFAEAKARARNVLKHDPKNVDALVLLGNSLAGMKDTEEGIGVLARAIQIDPELAGVYANLGVFQLAQGEQALAEQAFQKAVAVAPTSVEAQMNLGNFYKATRRYPEAEKTLLHALELEPKNLKVSDALASLYVAWGRPNLSEPYFKSMVEIAKDEKSRLALAGYYISVNRFPDALKTLQELAADKKYYAKASVGIAMLEYAMGDRPRAHKLIDEVLAREPNNAGALTVKARLLLAERKPTEALERIKAAVAVDPRSAEAQLTLARVQMAMRDVETARKAFNDTLKLDPHSLAAQLELSELHRNRNEIDTAIQFAEQAIADNPRNLAARLTLVRALMVRDQDHSRAEKELQTILSRQPNSPRAHGVLGQLLLSRNDLTPAQRSFERELALDPQSAEAITGLVAIDLSHKKTVEARAKVDAFLARHPNQPEVLVLAAKVYKEANQPPAKVEALLNRALAADPANPATYALLAQLYVSQKRLVEAKKQFTQIVKLEPRSVAAITMMGLLCYVSGDLDEAQQWWEKALQIDSYAAAAANDLAWLYAEGRGSLEVALLLAQTAKSKYPNLPEVNDTLGWVYYRKDLVVQAIVFLQQSLDMEPRNPVYHYHLGMAYARKGDDAKARRLLEGALKIDPKFAYAASAKKTLESLVY
jgi:tetratricopeptide (TPR) repeat protein